jgi:pimeloyl-ACP methyl ester carboxylesterase
MLKTLCSFVAIMSCSFDPTPNPVGLWEGTLDVRTIKLRMAFKIEKKEDGTLTAKMDSPDQGVKDIAMDEVKLEGKTLTIEFKPGKATYKGDISDDGTTINGNWKQAGLDLPFELKKVEKLTELKRPQEPKKPYPYHEEDVTFENTSAKIKLAGTFTKPKEGGPFTAVVLVTGSGPQDRDESLLGHKPFLVLADHLTRKGIAVLRFDDRGVGKSEGKHSTATSADFATDAYAAVQYLKTRNDVDAKRIGIAGHSEGGLIAPMVAADHPEDVGFIVLMAGTGLPGDQVLSDQLVAILKAKGLSERDIQLQRDLQRKLITITKAGGESKELAKKLAAAAKEHLDQLPEPDRKIVETMSGTLPKTGKADGKDKDKKADDDEASAYRRLANPWMITFLNFDPRPVLQRVRCPVLALNGEFDLQVTVKENLPAIGVALKAGNNSRVKLVELPGLNHLFQHTKTGDPGEYGTIEETFAIEAMDAIAEWIKQLEFGSRR